MKYKKYPKVRNHCHYTGEYRDAVHNKCNLKYSVPEKNSKWNLTLIIISS